MEDFLTILTWFSPVPRTERERDDDESVDPSTYLSIWEWLCFRVPGGAEALGVGWRVGLQYWDRES